jgi:hypothetical protein
MDKISVKKGSVLIECARTDLIGVDQTPDGVVFTLRGGLLLHVTDTDMPIHTKDMMKNAGDSFQKGHLTFNLESYNIPTSLEIL